MEMAMEATIKVIIEGTIHMGVAIRNTMRMRITIPIPIIAAAIAMSTIRMKIQTDTTPCKITEDQMINSTIETTKIITPGIMIMTMTEATVTVAVTEAVAITVIAIEIAIAIATTPYLHHLL